MTLTTMILNLGVMLLSMSRLMADATLEELEFSKKVYDLMVAARGGKHVKYSPNMAKIAQLHATDLDSNHNIKQKYCNMHSWYIPNADCCYTKNHGEAECMWDKPRQFSNYTGNGYEVAFFGKGYGIDEKSVIDGFIGSEGHRKVVLNQAEWAKDWNACGVGHKGGYTTIWFGHEEDSQANGKYDYPDPNQSKYPIEQEKPAPAYPSGGTPAPAPAYPSADKPASPVTTTTSTISYTTTINGSTSTYVTTITASTTNAPSPTVTQSLSTSASPAVTEPAPASPTATQSLSTSSSPAVTEPTPANPACSPPSPTNGDFYYWSDNKWVYVPKLTWVAPSPDRPADALAIGYFQASSQTPPSPSPAPSSTSAPAP